MQTSDKLSKIQTKMTLIKKEIVSKRIIYHVLLFSKSYLKVSINTITFLDLEIIPKFIGTA